MKTNTKEEDEVVLCFAEAIEFYLHVVSWFLMGLGRVGFG